MKKYLITIIALLSVILHAQNLNEIIKTFQDGEQEKALAKINTVIKLEPKNKLALTIRSQFYARLNRFEEMMKDLDQLTQLDPENVSVFLQRAAVKRYLKRYNQAIMDYRKASKIEPRKIEPLLQILSILIQDLSDIPCSIAEASRIIHAFPDYKPTYFSRGYLWAILGDLLNAYQDLSTVIEMDPKSVDAYNAMAWWLATYPDAKYRDGKKAVEYALVACENSAWKDPRVIDTLASAYAEVDNFNEAKELIVLALKLVKEKTEDYQTLINHQNLFTQNKKVRKYPTLQR
jgi:tetratricopeptide (TPR) repeat protein